jgi:hypothetical protein
MLPTLALQLWPKDTGDQIILVACGVLLMVFGYQVGRFVGVLTTRRKMSGKEQDLFIAQKGFKQLYEQELATAKAESARLADEVKTLQARVEDYRKKAAGYGGLFNSGGKKADAMYALLMENEALEEALLNQNEKMKQDRSDSLKETMRSTGYRRVLMSQLMNDERIKGYVEEILADGKHLPAKPDGPELRALPE